MAGFLGDTPYSDAFHLVWSHGVLHPARKYTFEKVQLIHHQRRIFRDVVAGKFTSTLMDVLARFKFAQSTDPRDKIFGLLGLVSETHDIQVDYNMTVAQVFGQICRFFIESRGNLDIVCQNPWQVKDEGQGAPPPMPGSGDGPSGRLHSLPSSVADFSLEKSSGLDDRFSALLFAQRGIFSAGAGTCPMPCQMEGEAGLQVKATLLDRVGRILQSEYGERQQVISWEPTPTSIIRRWRDLYVRSPQGHDRDVSMGLSVYEATGEPATQAYWRTLVMDSKAFPIERLTKEDIVSDGRTFAQLLSGDSSAIPDESETLTDEILYNLRSINMLRRSHGHWTFTVSANGLYSMIKKGVREGDILAVLDGGKVPVILRQVEGDNLHFKFVGTTYVHGYMSGEAKIAVENGELETKDIFLV